MRNQHRKLIAGFALAKLIILLACQTTLTAPLPAGVSVTLTRADGAEILVGDTVSIAVVVTNRSAAAFSMLYPAIQRFSYRSVVFSIAPPGSTEGIPVEFPGIYVGGMKSTASPKTLPTLTILPGEGTNIEFGLDYDCPTITARRLLFAVPGEYRIKAKLKVLRTPVVGSLTVPFDTDSEPFETEPLLVTVIEPRDNSDREAYAELRQLPHDFLLYAPDQFKPDGHPGAVSEIEAFFNKHTANRYGRQAQLFLCYAKILQGETQNDHQLVISGSAEARQIASDPNLPRFLRSRAERLIGRAQAWDAAHPTSTVQFVRHPAMAAVIKELESQLYDVKGWGRRNPESRKVYIERLLFKNDDLGQGKLTEDEFNRWHADWLRECVTNYSKPLSTEEWKSRYEQYSKEEAEQARQRELDMQKAGEQMQQYLETERIQKRQK